jgi:hypothetical protein
MKSLCQRYLYSTSKVLYTTHTWKLHKNIIFFLLLIIAVAWWTSRISDTLFISIQFNSFQWFIYMLSSTVNGQVRSQHEYKRQQQLDNMRPNKKWREITEKQIKKGSVKAFTFKHDLLKISVHLQTAFAAETHLAEW